MSLDPHEFAAIYRQEVGRATATLVRVLGDVDAAEDAVAEAFAVAAQRWAADGVPPNPGGWITTTARNRAIDGTRRDARRQAREREATVLHDPAPAARPHLGDLDNVPDDQLRLIFLCCHPALATDAQVALVLRLLGGLKTEEIARAFLIPTSTMGQRLSRAKAKIRDSHISYRVPAAVDLPERLAPVLAAIYLIYTEGHSATAGGNLLRPTLTTEAIRLGRTLTDLLPDEPEAVGLLALMLLTQARAAARIDQHGALVRLADQDRSLWDDRLIAEGHALVRRCLAVGRPGPYQLQAAIAAVHADARSAAETDWSQIIALYDALLEPRRHPVAALNRAVAVLEQYGPAVALRDLDAIELPNYYLFHATRAEALRRAGRHDESATALRKALSLTTNEAARRDLRRQLQQLDSGRTPEGLPAAEQEQHSG